MRRDRSPTLTVLLCLVVAVLGTATLLGKFGRWNWVCDLFAHFPLQYTVALLGTMLAALLLRRWRTALAAALLLVPNLAALSYYYPATLDAASPPDLRLVSFNVLTTNQRYDDVRDYLAASDADIILVMETDRTWLEALAPLRDSHPHVLKAPRGDNFGIGFLSRHPIESYAFRTVEGSRVPCLSAVVSVNGHRIDVIGGHPVPPIGAARAASRNAYLDELANLARESSRPTIVMGDLNVTAWSPHFRDMLESAALRDSGRKRGFQATWRRSFPPFAIPIDHVLHSDDLRSVGRETGPNLGSDHRPVMVELAFEGE